MRGKEEKKQNVSILAEEKKRRTSSFATLQVGVVLVNVPRQPKVRDLADLLGREQHVPRREVSVNQLGRVFNEISPS